ncbi:MAG: AAA family ATPase, partial [Candidatus Dormibacteria bacterium]
MRVKSVTVSGFGALWGKFEFDEEMTLVGGPNESGKSTLHTALRLALCGVERTPRGHVSKEAEELLRRYRPWDVGRFTVEAEVELEGCRYRFVRDLDKPDGDQVFDLTKGGDVTDKFRRGRGVDLAAGLDLGRAAFLSISTVAQDQILSLSGEALRQDLQRASATSGAEGTARAAIDRLERWRQDRIRGDKTTTKPLDTKMKPKELEEARSQLEQAREARRQLDEDLGQRDHLAAELAQAETAAREAEGGWKAKELLELEQDLQQLEEIGQELERTPSGRPPKDPAALREAATGSKGLLKQWQEAEAKVQELTPPEAELERLAKDSHQGELNFLATALDQEAPPLPDEAEAPRRLELLDRRRIGSVRVLADVLAVVGGVAGLCLIGFGIFYGGRQAILFDVAGLVVLVLTGT